MSSNPRLQASHLTSVLLPSGKVLVVGGDTAELYDPEQDTWTATSSLLEPRSEHTLTLLPSGQVLVSGGDDGTGLMGQPGELVLAERYDSATGVWTPVASLADRRARHTATALPSGKVLVVGGAADAELYDPGTDP